MEFLPLLEKIHLTESQLRFFLDPNSSRGVFLFQITKTIHLFAILIKNIYLNFQTKINFIYDNIQILITKLNSDMYKETPKTPVKIFLFFKRRCETIFSANLTETSIFLHFHIINSENYVQICKIN